MVMPGTVRSKFIEVPQVSGTDPYRAQKFDMPRAKSDRAPYLGVETMPKVLRAVSATRSVAAPGVDL